MTLEATREVNPNEFALDYIRRYYRGETEHRTFDPEWLTGATAYECDVSEDEARASVEAAQALYHEENNRRTERLQWVEKFANGIAAAGRAAQAEERRIADRARIAEEAKERQARRQTADDRRSRRVEATLRALRARFGDYELASLAGQVATVLVSDYGKGFPECRASYRQLQKRLHRGQASIRAAGEMLERQGIVSVYRPPVHGDPHDRRNRRGKWAALRTRYRFRPVRDWGNAAR